jgi:hypothetical protein
VTALFATFVVQAQEGGPPRATIDFSLYPYQSKLDNDVDFATMINARLPGRFSYFGYVNMKGALTSESFVFDRSEQNLRYSVSDNLPLDLNFQGVLARGDGNDFYQLGIGWRVHNTPTWQEFFGRINLIYRMTVQLRRFEAADSSSWALEHWFRMTFPQVSDRLYLSGFIDQAFDETLPAAMPDSPIVTEIQLGMRVFDQFYAVGEYRKNQRRVGNENNFAVGIEYKIRWQ